MCRITVKKEKSFNYYQYFYLNFPDYYFRTEPGKELSYQGSFAISYHDSYQAALTNASSFQNQENTIYIKALEKALGTLPLLRLSLLLVDILAIDRYI